MLVILFVLPLVVLLVLVAKDRVTNLRDERDQWEEIARSSAGVVAVLEVRVTELEDGLEASARRTFRVRSEFAEYVSLNSSFMNAKN